MLRPPNQMPSGQMAQTDMTTSVDFEILSGASHLLLKMLKLSLMAIYKNQRQPKVIKPGKIDKASVQINTRI